MIINKHKKFGVAAIINEFKIIVNYGKRDGAHEGDKIKVLSDSYEDILDPFTSEPIGKIYNIKEFLTIDSVDEKNSTCIKDSQTTLNSFHKAISLSFNNDSNNRLRVEMKKPLQVKTGEPIKTGDLIEIN